MAENVGITVKDRIGELIATIQSCATSDGVSELEKLYNSKKKELGGSITPMMDITVRDAIKGKYSEIKAAADEAAEIEAERKAASNEAKLAKKLDESIQVKVVQYNEFLKSDKPINETNINVGVFTFARMNPPSQAHMNLMAQISVVAESVGGLGMVYLSHSQDPVRNPLPYSDKIRFVESIAPNNVSIQNSELRNLFSILESLPNRGFTDLYAVVGSDRVDEFSRAGRYFLEKGGNSFTVVVSGDRLKNSVSSTELRSLVEANKYTEFCKMNSHLSGEQAAELFECVANNMRS